MSVISGEVIPDPIGGRSWAVVIKHDDSVVATIPFPSEEKGERFLLEALNYIQEKGKADGDF